MEDLQYHPVLLEQKEEVFKNGFWITESSIRARANDFYYYIYGAVTCLTRGEDPFGIAGDEDISATHGWSFDVHIEPKNLCAVFIIHTDFNRRVRVTVTDGASVDPRRWYNIKE